MPWGLYTLGTLVFWNGLPLVGHFVSEALFNVTFEERSYTC